MGHPHGDEAHRVTEVFDLKGKTLTNILGNEKQGQSTYIVQLHGLQRGGF